MKYIEGSNVSNLDIQTIPSSCAPLGGHVDPGDNKDTVGCCFFVCRKGLTDVQAGSSEDVHIAVHPVENMPLSIRIVQVSQQGGNHCESGRHLAEVVSLCRGFDD